MLDEEGINRFFNQIFELWINPELEKRKQDGEITSSFTFDCAEVVMFGDGRPLVVRFNEEVRSIFHLKMPSEKAANLKMGDTISIAGIEILDITPPKDEVNDAHVVLACNGKVWAYTFNFTYNSGHIAECFMAATEFYETAKDSLALGRTRSFIDCLFSSVELTSRCLLLMMPGKTKHSHQYIQTQINIRKKNNVAGGGFASLLNRLSVERDKARYTSLAYNTQHFKLESLLKEADSFLKFCEPQIPRRAKEILKSNKLTI